MIGPFVLWKAFLGGSNRRSLAQRFSTGCGVKSRTTGRLPSCWNFSLLRTRIPVGWLLRLSICSRRVIMSLTSNAAKADRSWNQEGDGRRKVVTQAMTAFKSNRSMRLKGKTARRWAKTIRTEKEQQQNNGKAKKK